MHDQSVLDDIVVQIHGNWVVDVSAFGTTILQSGTITIRPKEPTDTLLFELDHGHVAIGGLPDFKFSESGEQWVPWWVSTTLLGFLTPYILRELGALTGHD